MTSKSPSSLRPGSIEEAEKQLDQLERYIEAKVAKVDRIEKRRDNPEFDDEEIKTGVVPVLAPAR